LSDIYLTHSVDLRQARFCPEWFALRKTGWQVIWGVVFTVWRVKEQLSIISVAQLKAWKHL